MGFKEDLDNDLSTVFMNKDEFAEQITFTPQAPPSTPYNLNGIFDKEFFAVDPETNAQIIATQPNIRVKEADLQAAVQPGDKVTIRGTVYEIVKPETDGVGTIVLFLHVAT